jgi:hypothetical protein
MLRHVGARGSTIYLPEVPATTFFLYLTAPELLPTWNSLNMYCTYLQSNYGFSYLVGRSVTVRATINETTCICRFYLLFIYTILALKALLLVLGGIPLPPDDILQPLRHGIHRVHQAHTHEVSISVVSTEFVIASYTEIQVP